MAEKEICQQCGKKFSYVIADTGAPGGKEREYIYCPYCRAENGSVVTNGFINTYKEDGEK